MIIPAQLKIKLKKQLINQLINFYFYVAKEQMQVAVKDQLVIESAAPYCCKLKTRKLPNTTTKKKRKSIHNMLFFPLNDGHKSLFAIYTMHRKKNNKNAQKKISKNIQSQTDYKNHDISILRINQIIFYLSYLTIFRNFVLSQATV